MEGSAQFFYHLLDMISHDIYIINTSLTMSFISCNKNRVRHGFGEDLCYSSSSSSSLALASPSSTSWSTSSATSPATSSATSSAGAGGDEDVEDSPKCCSSHRMLHSRPWERWQCLIRTCEICDQNVWSESVRQSKSEYLIKWECVTKVLRKVMQWKCFIRKN